MDRAPEFPEGESMVNKTGPLLRGILVGAITLATVGTFVIPANAATIITTPICASATADSSA
jgi:hypothetical protein